MPGRNAVFRMARQREPCSFSPPESTDGAALYAPNPEWIGTLRAFGGFMALYGLSAFGYRTAGKFVCSAAIFLAATQVGTVPPFVFGSLFLVSGVMDLL